MSTSLHGFLQPGVHLALGTPASSLLGFCLIVVGMDVI